MATVYIIYSKSIDKFYVGSCIDFPQRLQEHNSGFYKGAFTSRASDWQTFFTLDELDYALARKVERHIKQMKSRRYFQRLKESPKSVSRLLSKFQ